MGCGQGTRLPFLSFTVSHNRVRSDLLTDWPPGLHKTDGHLADAPWLMGERLGGFLLKTGLVAKQVNGSGKKG